MHIRALLGRCGVFIGLSVVLAACSTEMEDEARAEAEGMSESAQQDGAQDLLADGSSEIAAEAALAPGGRPYWSASYGHFVMGDNAWVRKARYTLSARTSTTGTVSAIMTQWNGPNAPSRAVAGGTGPSNGMANCNVLTPKPERSLTWTGTYTFTGQGASGALSIQWSNGSAEEWALDELRGGTLGRMTMTKSDFPGSDATAGVGYGTKLPFSVYKTVTQSDSVARTFLGHSDYQSPVAAKSVRWNLNLGSMQRTSSTSQTLSVTQSMDKAGAVAGSCTHDIKGNIYNLFVTGRGRQMVLNHYWRCLVQKEVGCYAGGMHTDLLDQVIDDENNLVGVVGVEASTSGGYTYARIDAIAAEGE